jgi:hypothetical protein
MHQTQSPSPANQSKSSMSYTTLADLVEGLDLGLAGDQLA